jgi:hypothetical protein
LVSRRRPPRRRPPIGCAHRHAFAIDAEDEHRTGVLDGLGCGTALGGIEHLKILRRPHDQLLGLALRHMSPTRGREGGDDVVQRVLGGFRCHALPYTVRVPLRRQVQRRIQGMQAWGATSSIPHTHDLDLTEQRHQVSRVASLWRAGMTSSVEDRGRHSARATLIQVGLPQAAQQFAAFNLQQRFQFAVGHLVDLRRVQLRDKIIEMLVGSGVDIGDWQGMSDSTGWHHQSSLWSDRVMMPHLYHRRPAVAP